MAYVLRVSLNPDSRNYFRIAVSLCKSLFSKTLIVSLVFSISFSLIFNGDKIQGTENTVIEKLSNLQNIDDILREKISSVLRNVWVVEAWNFNGPFAVYNEFFGRKNLGGKQVCVPTLTDDASCFNQPKTIIFVSTREIHGEDQILVNLKDKLSNSISQFHYVDVGLNSTGAYLTDSLVTDGIVMRVLIGVAGIRFVLYGTPRQWCDNRRAWIQDEMERLFQCLQDAELKTEGKLQAVKRYFR
ncbi:hypothetical protein MKX01_041967 [Papaver californicum]|nr:hypothetical protein MKX01_041967 [Papaver californicum]